MTQTTEFVINFHMTESCNYACNFCYAIWNNQNSKQELHRQPHEVKRLLNDLAQYFLHDNPIRKSMGYTDVRINFAGGEPLLLGDRLPLAIQQAHELGFRTSIITNGHFLSNNMLEHIGSMLNILGLSCDTVVKSIQKNIGRMDRKGNYLTENDFIRMIKTYRDVNPNGMVKINTVVNKMNWQDDMNETISKIKPDKWKVFQVLPAINNISEITHQQFEYYVTSHQEHQKIMLIEPNDIMIESYLMINPMGQFYQNQREEKGYKYSSPILRAGVEKALSEVQFNQSLFASRY